jgi:hypothetical protein
VKGEKILQDIFTWGATSMLICGTINILLSIDFISFTSFILEFTRIFFVISTIICCITLLILCIFYEQPSSK